MDVNVCFEKWLNILRIKNQWDVKLEMVSDPEFKKTGDFKIDCDDRKAILLLNERNPRQENFEEVIVHELLHLKLYPLDQITEGLIYSKYEEGSKALFCICSVYEIFSNHCGRIDKVFSYSIWG